MLPLRRGSSMRACRPLLKLSCRGCTSILPPAVALPAADEHEISVHAHFVAQGLLLPMPNKPSKPSITRFGRQVGHDGHWVKVAKSSAIIQMNQGVHPHKYIVLFDYGSVVFFGLDQSERKEYLRHGIKQYVEGPAITCEEGEDHMICVKPDMTVPCRIEPECTFLQTLDISYIQVISGIMAQSVALGYYSKVAGTILQTFTDMNSDIQRTGIMVNAKEKERRELFKLVAQNNAVLIKIIGKMGLLERSETAWEDIQYHRVWEAMREDFELKVRFENLKYKLDVVTHNTKFILEMVHHAKSDKLEWIIIILISFEIMVALADMAGFDPRKLSEYYASLQETARLLTGKAKEEDPATCS
ncbi:unnamed protein product [Chrysoparadoxa australica]